MRLIQVGLCVDIFGSRIQTAPSSFLANGASLPRLVQEDISHMCDGNGYTFHWLGNIRRAGAERGFSSGEIRLFSGLHLYTL